MMCCCEKCKFVFESVRVLDRCPDCGHGPVREATDAEVAEYQAFREEYGPMPVYGLSNLYAVTQVEIPVLVSVKNGRPVFERQWVAAPSFYL